MKKLSTRLPFIFLMIFIFVLIVLMTKNVSYSFFKNIFQNTQEKQEVKLSIPKKHIDDLEDLVFIPDIKYFKESFLKKINENSYIEIFIPENVLNFYRFDPKKNTYVLFRKYPITVGKPNTPSPIGEGIVYTKGHIVFKYHYGEKQNTVITNGHDERGNVFRVPYEKMYGLYLIVNQTLSYVIHSTTETWNIGGAHSSGCIRMMISDMLDLYPYIQPVIKVKIKYELFRLENDLLTIYPDIYHQNTSLYSALIEFFKNNNINPIIFDSTKIKQAIYNELPTTISLNDLLADFFVKKNLKYNEIKIDYNNIPIKQQAINFDEFKIQNKAQ